MRTKWSLYIVTTLLFFCACEEVIEVDLNDADPRVVFEANLSNLSTIQHIRISKTVAFKASFNSLGIADAAVLVTDDKGVYYPFLHEGDGNYVARNFMPIPGRSYWLQAIVDGELFEANSHMPVYVEVDSTGLTRESILGKNYYFATFKFYDQADKSDYYKYDIAINDGGFRFSAVFNDKFNDGLYVTHQVSDLDAELKPGDYLSVRRYCVDENVFQYWNEYQSTNLGSAAPANPTSNISNQALGYFSVASVQEFRIQIVDVERESPDL